MKPARMTFAVVLMMIIAATAWAITYNVTFDADCDGFTFDVSGVSWVDYTFEYTVVASNNDTGELYTFSGSDVIGAGPIADPPDNRVVDDAVSGTWDLPYGDYSVIADYTMTTDKSDLYPDKYPTIEGSFGPIDLTCEAPVVHKNPIFRCFFNFFFRWFRCWFRW